MRVEILHVPDCPNVAVLEQRLHEAAEAAGSVGLEVTRRVVADLETAVAVSMTGSPTLLVGGVDPFARPDHTPSMSCRLYLDEAGAIAGAPSVAALRRALDGDHTPIASSDPCEDCCGSPTTGGAALHSARRRRCR